MHINLRLHLTSILYRLSCAMRVDPTGTLYVTRTLATTAAHEISPVCAVVGGLLAQDILKALAAREPPIANFFTFDGNLGGGTVVRMAMP